MNLSRTLLVVGCLGLGFQSAACGGGSAQSADAKSAPALPLDAAMREVELANRLGKLMIRQDTFAARATDLMLQSPPPEDAAGWVAYDVPGGAQVAFLGGAGNAYYAFTRVSFTDLPDGKVQEEVVRERSDISQEELEIFRARQVASAQEFLRCSPRYNVVTLPASLLGQEGWIVYLLPADLEASDRRLAGYHRFVVGKDGSVASHASFNKACMNETVAPLSPGETLAGVFLNHVTSDTPVESHVFLSAHYDLPLQIAAGGRVWSVSPSEGIAKPAE